MRGELNGPLWVKKRLYMQEHTEKVEIEWESGHIVTIQRGTAINRVIAINTVADQLVDKLRRKMEALSVGSPLEDAVIVPLINKQAADFAGGLVKDAIAKQEIIRTGGQQVENFVYPTLLDHVTTEMRIAEEEAFGPVLPVIRADSQEEAVRLVNHSGYCRQTSVFTENIIQTLVFAEEMEAGIVHINGKTKTGTDLFSFPGKRVCKNREQRIQSILTSMTRPKAVLLKIQ